MNIPLAERLRPTTLDNYVGQQHIVGANSFLRKCIAMGNLPSLILWGPPGVGKTTLANIIAKSIDAQLYTLSAVNAGVKDVREIIERAEKDIFKKTILFIDEIHRFNKSQQDALLHAVEKGIITLIGATTENPSFEVINALQSRCQLFVLHHLSKDELITLLHRAISTDEYLCKRNIVINEYEALLQLSGGDARKLLNTLDILVSSTYASSIIITNAMVLETVQTNIALYDKNGEQHYDIVSAFIKSMRGSDPNAAVYYLARMLKGGEDVKFIARRMLIFASEDVGNANPNALLLANSCFDAVSKIGMPEARIILSQCATYMASSVKSNASYLAINNAFATVDATGNLPVPLHLRNAPTKLMKELNYGKGYTYSHNYATQSAEAAQEFLPTELSNTTFYTPTNNGSEANLLKHLREVWKGKYGY
ncbi:MAG: replication-associated recombination protein A [Bacteroidia bacterium]|nr:replication-associated recombination protein A [Bacteroidia bacterium]